MGTATGVAGTVTQTRASALNSSGTSQAPLFFKTPDTTPSGVADATLGKPVESQATLNIPAGTALTAADGSAITGAITANVVSYASTQDNALMAFPGGFSVNVAGTDPDTGTSSGTGTGNFISGGFVAFNLVDSTGKTVKNFSQPVTTTITVPKGTLNPDTGVEVAVGESLPIYSYDEVAGAWSKEKSGTVTATDAQGNYVLTFQVTHLSYWNMDWHYSAVCNASLNVTGLPASNPPSVSLRAKFTNYSGYLYEGAADRNGVFAVANAPKNKPMLIEALYRGKVVGRATVGNLCAGTVQLPVTLPVVQTGSVAGNVYEACFTKGVPVASTRRTLATQFYIWDYQNWQSPFFATVATSATGRYQISSIPVGTTYTAYTYSPRTYKSQTRTVSVTSNTTAALADFVFEMPCKPRATGAAGAGG